MPVICIDARLIEVVANHTFVPADARANEQSVRAKSALPPTPDIHFVRRHVRNVPTAEVLVRPLDWLVRQPSVSKGGSYSVSRFL
jgi:hypothetical protein